MAEGYLLGKEAIKQVEKTVREVSRRMMNETQTRARWHGLRGGAVNVKHGIVIASLTRGYYTIRLSEWSADALPDTEAEETLCEILNDQVDIEGESYTNCETEHELPEFVETEDETTKPIVTRQTTAVTPTEDVTAFHRASIFVPLALWSEVVMIDTGDMIGETKIYQIIDGFQEHIVEYDKEFECCETTGEWKLIHRTPIIFAGIRCVTDDCEPCPTE